MIENGGLMEPLLDREELYAGLSETALNNEISKIFFRGYRSVTIYLHPKDFLRIRLWSWYLSNNYGVLADTFGVGIIYYLTASGIVAKCVLDVTVEEDNPVFTQDDHIDDRQWQVS